MRSNSTAHISNLAIAALAITAGVASAQVAPPEQTVLEPERPWARGVPEAEQDKALTLYRMGNAAFEQRRYSEAKPQYEQALSHWDHPNIRYNLAITLVHLDEPIPAYDHLVKSLEFGAAPLGDAHFESGQTLKRSLERQIGTISLTVEQPGVTVRLDGNVVVDAPGTKAVRLTPGNHELFAEKSGHRSFSRSVSVFGGTSTTVDISLLKIETRLVRRWDPWKPWAVVGAGAAFVIAGIPLELSARSRTDEFEVAFADECPNGCPREQLTAATRDLESSAKTRNVLGVSALVIGGVGIAAGVVGVVLNQPRAIESPGPNTAVTPTVGRDSVGVSVLRRF